MVPEIKKILFTTDLSKESRQAFNYAASVADKFGASIVLLHVMEELSGPSSGYVKEFLGEDRWQELKKGHEQEARQILIGKKREGAMIRDALVEFTDNAKKDYDDLDFKADEIVVTRGNIVDEIIQESQNRNCSLIVMGYQVRGRLEEAVLGSTTRRVLRRSKIPVLLVRLTEGSF